jgi:preprotein translocase subunit YajC
MTELEKGDRVIVKSTGLRGVVLKVDNDYPPGYQSAEVQLDYDDLRAVYLVENLEVVEEQRRMGR